MNARRREKGSEQVREKALLAMAAKDDRARKLQEKRDAEAELKRAKEDERQSRKALCEGEVG